MKELLTDTRKLHLLHYMSLKGLPRLCNQKTGFPGYLQEANALFALSAFQGVHSLLEGSPSPLRFRFVSTIRPVVSDSPFLLDKSPDRKVHPLQQWGC
jgi:hypothetical protein